MNNIGQLVQGILEAAKKEQAVKTAQLEAIKEGESRPIMRNELASAMQKLAEELKTEQADITVEDLKTFVRSV